MDLVDVFRPVFDFFIKICGVPLTVGGYTFTVGAVFIWSAIVVVVWTFIRRAGD